MSSVLKNLVDQRHAVATSRSHGNGFVSNLLRLISLIVIAVAVYYYHETLFGAAQPYIQQLLQR